jgi:predicted nuclease with TOPRIM domain
MLLSKALKMM